MSFSQSVGSKGSDETQEKDANSQLMELDKGLGSSKVGEQCEAIVRFPRLFEKYPFPILINSAFLKLADVFRIGSNFLRLCILKVTQQSEKHLDKIINVEEFVRRVFSVIHSNDPVARAITLRVLGSCAPVIAERKNVHHSIVNGLDSHDSVEIEAAIAATNRFAQHSKSFAGSMCNKLADMIEKVETPVEMKLKLIPIFQHMHHDAATTVKVQILCQEMLSTYPAHGVNFVLVTLHTLTELSGHSLMDIPKQVDLLLQYVSSDCRKAVRTMALKDLLILANKGPHMWTTENIEKLCCFVLSTPYKAQKIGALTVLVALSKTIAITNFATYSDSKVIKLFSELSYHDNMWIAVKTVEVQTYVAIHQFKRGSKRMLEEEVPVTLETLLVVATTESTPDSAKVLKLCLQCVVAQSKISPNLIDNFVDMITSMLATVSEDCAVLLCDCLSSLGSHTNDLLRNLVPDIFDTLHQVALGNQPQKDARMVSLITLILQSYAGGKIEDKTAEDIIRLLDELDAWSAYQLARQAARYGHHQVSAHIFSALTSKVSSEHFYLWLSGLAEASQAESCLIGKVETVTQLTDKIAAAEMHYHKAITALKAATLPTKSLYFQCEYLQLRSQMLQLQLQLTKACSSFQTSPPPAIATSLAMTTGQEIHRYGHIVSELNKCKKQFEDLCGRYKMLYEASFDADPATLENVQLLQQVCQVFIYTLDSIMDNFTKSKVGEEMILSLGNESNHRIEHQALHGACSQMLCMVHGAVKVAAEAPITHQHVTCLTNVSKAVCDVPLSMPRYFFQSLQTTSLKLAISPQSRSNEAVSIHYDTHLTLKIEGIIQHGDQPEIFRKAHAVHLRVSSAPQAIHNNSADAKMKEAPNNDMSQTAEPHNDYFSSQFLLAFPITGQYTVCIEAAVVDVNGVVWNTGPKTTMEVKSYDEAVQRKQQQQYAAHRQQQRAQALTQF